MKFRTYEEAIQVRLPSSSAQVVTYFHKIAKEVRDGHASPASKLKKIYELSDAITREISPYAVCERGCSHCCYIDTRATTLEAQYVQRNLNFPMNEGASMTSGYSASRTPCPFLKDNECSIYEHRFFACRTYFVLDNPMICKSQNGKNVMYRAETSELLSKVQILIYGLNKNKPLRDVRDFFPKKVY